MIPLAAGAGTIADPGRWADAIIRVWKVIGWPALGLAVVFIVAWAWRGRRKGG